MVKFKLLNWGGGGGVRTSVIWPYLKVVLQYTNITCVQF